MARPVTLHPMNGGAHRLGEVGASGVAEPADAVGARAPMSRGPAAARRFAALSLLVAGISCSSSLSSSSTAGTGGAAGAGRPAGSGGAAADTSGTGGSLAGTGGIASPDADSGRVAETGGATAGGTAGGAGAGATGGGTGGRASGTGDIPTDGGGADAARGPAGGRSAPGSDGGAAGAGATAAVDGGVRSGSDGAAAPRRAAMVVQGTGTATPGDRVMLARLAAHGFVVTLFSDAAVTAAAVAQMDLVVISSSAESGPLGTKIRDVPVPILCIENGEYQFMGMTGPILDTDFGADTNQNQVRISAAPNSDAATLVGGLAGAVVISTVASDLGWGAPAPSALRAAVAAATPAHIVIFGYAKGAQMVGLTAPARRAGYAIRETLAANLAPGGIQLFDAILEWVLG